LPQSPDRPSRGLPRLLHAEFAGGVALLLATGVALVWANSGWRDGYRAVWQSGFRLQIGDVGFDGDLRHLVNEGLMALFFFVVGLEIKRELVTGQLRAWRTAALPAIAALGGMVVPAAVYLAVNAGGAGARGWGVPMATDIAFAVGVVSLLGRRVPSSLKLFLLTLAVVDDLGAIVVIAVFYARGISFAALVVAVLLLAVMGGLRAAGVAWLPVSVLLGVGVWLAVYESGVHATIAGAVLGLLAPVAVAERLEDRLQLVTGFVVIPLFALANAGVVLSADALDGPGRIRIALGVGLGLVVGKLVGVSGATWLAVRLGVGTLPEGVGWGQMIGIAAMAGIGFTVSLFVAGLAFNNPGAEDAAKIGVLAASVGASALGVAVLLATGRGRWPDDHPTGTLPR
jgi:NhaA family Na+:H+ antiporter